MLNIVLPSISILNIFMLSVITLNVVLTSTSILTIIMLSVIMLNAVLLSISIVNVIMLISVITLNVILPSISIQNVVMLRVVAAVFISFLGITITASGRVFNKLFKITVRTEMHGAYMTNTLAFYGINYGRKKF